jgi:hypothetical protein
MSASIPAPAFRWLDDDQRQFSLTWPNQPPKTYPFSKEGKRQAILDGLQRIPTLAVDQQQYLPSAPALELVALVLYPQGVASEDAYNLVRRTTAKACAAAGFAEEEVSLAPPQVPFPARGPYRLKQPDLQPDDVRAALDDAPLSPYEPRREIEARIIWNKMTWHVYGKSWSGVSVEQQSAIRNQVDAVAAAAGWQSDATHGRGLVYRRPISPDMAQAEQELLQRLRLAAGAPLSGYTVLEATMRGAFGRAYTAQYAPAPLLALIQTALTAQGYETETDANGYYQPQPLSPPADALDRFAARLAQCAPVPTPQGDCLWLSQLQDAVRELLAETNGDRPITDFLVERFLTQDAADLLRRAGYIPKLVQVRPNPVGRRPPDAHPGFLRELRLRRDDDKTVELTQGMRVRAPALTVDDVHDEIVYLELVGPKGAVRSNWAALAGKKVNWIGGQRIALNGMKNHIRLDAGLPCGWRHLVLIHRQASLQTANPEEPFYLLDDGRQPIPPLFYPLLNRALALPLLPDWADYLWREGRAARLIFLLDKGQGQRYAAWRVLPSPDKWQAIVKNGLANGPLSLAAAATNLMEVGS